MYSMKCPITVPGGVLHEPVAAAAVVDEDHEADGDAAEGVERAEPRPGRLLVLLLLLVPAEQAGQAGAGRASESSHQPPAGRRRQHHQAAHQQRQLGRHLTKKNNLNLPETKEFSLN